MAEGKLVTEEEIIKTLKNEVDEVKNITGLSIAVVKILLDAYNWDSVTLLDYFYSNENIAFEKAGYRQPGIPTISENKPATECEICMKDLETSVWHHEDCGHVFCGNCWKEYLRQAITEEAKSLRIECPMYECSTLLDELFICKILAEHEILLNKYWSLHATEYSKKKKTVSSCPRSDCQMFFMSTSRKEARVKCCCGQEYCFSCGNLYHFTVPCTLIENWDSKIFQKDDSQTGFMLLMTKKCPMCKTDIEKIGGCPKVACARCGERFCWICLTPMAQHTSCKEQSKAEDTREVEVVLNTGISEEKRFMLFQRKFNEVKSTIGKIEYSIETSSRNQGRTVLIISIKEFLRSMAKEMEAKLGWFSTEHLRKATEILEDTQAALMYAQVHQNFFIRVLQLPPPLLSKKCFNDPNSYKKISVFKPNSAANLIKLILN